MLEGKEGRSPAHQRRVLPVHEVGREGVAYPPGDRRGGAPARAVQVMREHLGARAAAGVKLGTESWRPGHDSLEHRRRPRLKQRSSSGHGSSFRWCWKPLRNLRKDPPPLPPALPPCVHVRVRAGAPSVPRGSREQWTRGRGPRPTPPRMLNTRGVSSFND